MTREEKIDKIYTILNEMDEGDLIYANNEYCDESGYYDDRIYYYEELDDLCYGMKPTEIIEQYGELANCEYFKCGVYIESADISDIDINEIATYCVDNGYDIGNYDIGEILDSDEDEDDEE